MKDLLEHRVGWNPPRAMDVMKELELDRMPREMDFLRWLASSPLTHGPKDPEKYSNEAFSALRLIINVVTGDYFKFMQKNVFGPAGAEAKEVGVSLSRPEDRESDEVYYITHVMTRASSQKTRDALFQLATGKSIWTT